jgi:hypothetical protein
MKKLLKINHNNPNLLNWQRITLKNKLQKQLIKQRNKIKRVKQNKKIKNNN